MFNTSSCSCFLWVPSHFLVFTCTEGSLTLSRLIILLLMIGNDGRVTGLLVHWLALTVGWLGYLCIDWRWRTGDWVTRALTGVDGGWLVYSCTDWCWRSVTGVLTGSPCRWHNGGSVDDLQRHSHGGLYWRLCRGEYVCLFWCQTDRQTDRLTDLLTNTQTVRQANGPADQQYR